MAFHIEDPEIEALARELAARAGVCEMQLIRDLLVERREREKKKAELVEWLELNIWSKIPPELRNLPPITKEEREEILGYGPYGV